MFNVPDPAVLIPLMFLIGVLPLAMVMMTAYTKIVVVLSLLKTHSVCSKSLPPSSPTAWLWF